MLRALNLTHYYSTTPVLRDINLTVPDGQSVALLGPNGIGKTTLLSILGGVQSPTFGHIEVNGFARRGSIDEELEIRRQCVFLPDDCWLPPDRSGGDWLLAVGRVYGVPDESLYPKAQSLIDVFNLEGVANYCLGDCSTGQKKKWALCSALLTDAKILLLDEPFSGGLDPAGILALQRILRHASASEGRTILFTTPVPEIVEGTADRLLVIENGTIAADEMVAELSARSESGSVTGLLQRMFFGTTLNRLESYFEGASQAASQNGRHAASGDFNV
jgi:ABC-2 type transport system ATP-binding protein